MRGEGSSADKGTPSMQAAQATGCSQRRQLGHAGLGSRAAAGVSDATSSDAHVAYAARWRFRSALGLIGSHGCWPLHRMARPCSSLVAGHVLP